MHRSVKVQRRRLDRPAPLEFRQELRVHAPQAFQSRGLRRDHRVARGGHLQRRIVEADQEVQGGTR